MYNKKTNSALLNWKKPKSRNMGSKGLPSDFILIKNFKAGEKHKHPQVKIYFSEKTLKAYFKELKDVNTVAFSFEEERILMVFDPPAEVPTYKARRTKSAHREISNKDLISDIWDFFKIGGDQMLFKLFYYAEVNKMKLYSIMPYKDKITPLFDNDHKPLTV